jgi:outer membrane protein
VAVGVLYYLHFSGSSNGQSLGTAGGADLGELRIAYINTDTILEHYDYVKARTEILEAKSKRLENDYRNRAQNLQGEISSYQRNANNMTIGQMKAVEEDLGKKQQNLQLFEQSITQELMNDQNKVSQELYERITKYLNKYCEDSNLQLVFKYNTASDVLYGREGLDITTDVLAGLNGAYNNEKLNKSDSTATKK